MQALKSNQLFVKLTDKELHVIAKMVHIRNYEPNEIIFDQGEKGLGMYIIIKGNVEITRGIPEKPAQEFSVATLEPGNFFGELALCSRDSRRTACAYARGQTTLIGFFKPDLIDIMERKPEMGVKILFQLSRVVARRLVETNTAFAQSVLETELHTNHSSALTEGEVTGAIDIKKKAS